MPSLPTITKPRSPYTGRIVLALAGVGIVAGAIALNPLSTPRAALARTTEHAEAAPNTYEIDSVHSSVIFRVKHMNTSNFYGRLNEAAGSFSLGETASFNITVKSDSVDSGDAKRDQHIKSADFFGAKEFPEMTAVGKDFKKAGDNQWKGTANLTFHGTTKPIDLTITQTGAGKGRDKSEIAGIETTFTFKRSEFGSKGLIGPVSDEVMIIAAFEGGAK